jgi:hypothetical protein
MSAPTIVRNGRGYKDVFTSASGSQTGQTWTIIQAVQDTAFTTLTGDITTGGPSTLPAGSILEGEFTVIHLTSGEVVAYRKP